MENGYNDTYNKAMVLMQGALKKFNDGDFKGGEKQRRQANDMFDLAEKEVNMEQSKNSMLYGESRNFGIIYKTFEKNAGKLYKSNEGRKTIAKVVKMIRENKVLKQQFDMYNSLSSINEAVKDAVGVDTYTKKVMELTPHMTRKEIVENNEKLIELMQKCGVDEMVQINDDDFKFFESVEYVMLNKPTIGNMQEYLLNEQVIEKRLNENVTKTVEKTDINEAFTENIKTMGIKYHYILNDSEKRMLDRITNSENIENAFNEDKETLIGTLKKMLEESKDNTEKEEWKSIIEHVNSMKYNKDTAVDDIIKIDRITKATLE